MGDTIRARKELAKTIAENPYISPYSLAIAYVGLKDYNKAMDFLEQAYDERSLGVYGMAIDTVMTPIRNEPRFKALMKKINLE